MMEEMAKLLEQVLACDGDEEMLDGWALERQATRGDKIYVAPDGATKLFSRLQVLRFLELDPSVGKRKLKAEKEAKAAKRQAQVAQRQDKQEVRNHFHAQIKSIMDLEAQEKFLNAQGRRTLRDPLRPRRHCDQKWARRAP